ncbi:hypothetical protein ATCVNEJV3_559L [Acanthocystis turfacea Chlorella virus NE-JV-3]|nr:hypothetical protein ATCVCan0610SP_557L [Acanthocystis turfacea Chlorella virus Can0610SP]AGE57011.1 hypothetical protein ATCVNEJV3_559L [Acanthocystis turfacea Chlorella virus NE-JV-3]
MSLTFAAISLATLGALVFKNHSATRSVVSDVNGKEYVVIDTGDYQGAADMLAHLEDTSRRFIDAAIAAYPAENHLKRVKKYWTGTLSEIPQSDTIAYTIEKKDLYICVRDPSGNIQNFDDLLFVLLHELSHIMNPSFGHDDAFWGQFKRTLEIANKLGYLPYKDYDDYSVTVCGKTISSNPMTCVTRGTCSSSIGPLRPR